eukprot:3332319-Amphidinium_carterae.1
MKPPPPLPSTPPQLIHNECPPPASLRGQDRAPGDQEQALLPPPQWPPPAGVTGPPAKAAPQQPMQLASGPLANGQPFAEQAPWTPPSFIPHADTPSPISPPDDDVEMVTPGQEPPSTIACSNQQSPSPPPAATQQPTTPPPVASASATAEPCLCVGSPPPNLSEADRRFVTALDQMSVAQLRSEQLRVQKLLQEVQAMDMPPDTISALQMRVGAIDMALEAKKPTAQRLAEALRQARLTTQTKTRAMQQFAALQEQLSNASIQVQEAQAAEAQALSVVQRIQREIAEHAAPMPAQTPASQHAMME